MLPSRLEQLLPHHRYETIWKRLAGWIGHRVRAILLKQWKTPRRCYQAAMQLTPNDRAARLIAGNLNRYWATSGQSMNMIVTTKHLTGWGLYDLRQHAR